MISAAYRAARGSQLWRRFLDLSVSLCALVWRVEILLQGNNGRSTAERGVPRWASVPIVIGPNRHTSYVHVILLSPLQTTGPRASCTLTGTRDSTGQPITSGIVALPACACEAAGGALRVSVTLYMLSLLSLLSLLSAETTAAHLPS